MLVSAFCLLLAAAEPAAQSDRAPARPGVVISSPAKADDPLELEYLKLLEEDDAAQKQADKIIRENEAFAARGAGMSEAAVRQKVELVFEVVEKHYDEFLRRHPKHIRARLAYGSFLNDINKEEEAIEQWDTARKLEPDNPASWNNLANIYGHHGPVKKAFEYYDKAISLNTNEPVYYHNLATVVYLFRKDAKEYYNINEQQVFDRALELYGKAQKLDPKDFQLATDIAQTYYGIKPQRTKDALAAWEVALNLAGTPEEREGIYLHIARVKIGASDFDGARASLESVTNASYAVLKTRLLRSLTNHAAKVTQGVTNEASAKPAEPSPAK
ncbi:MAG TPA: tetratricopeptide repeat protein [Verrucomicrobiae bacterium]|nr:tetratricopeptide repeat protein [Verrucomicrobiae bacterium]